MTGKEILSRLTSSTISFSKQLRRIDHCYLSTRPRRCFLSRQRRSLICPTQCVSLGNQRASGWARYGPFQIINSVDLESIFSYCLAANHGQHLSMLISIVQGIVTVLPNGLLNGPWWTAASVPVFKSCLSHFEDTETWEVGSLTSVYK